MINNIDLEKIKKEVYPDHILMEIFTDSIGSVCVHLAKRIGVGQWQTDTEDWSDVVGGYNPNMTLWTLLN
jgi:hypothetical protein